MELVRDFIGNPGDAAERLLARLRIIPRILAALNYKRGRRLDDHELADLTQDVFLLVLRKLAGFFGKGSLDGWLYRICELELMNRLRQRSRGPVLLGDVPPEAEPATAPPEEHEHLVEMALARLGGYEGDVIRQRLLDEASFEDIAARHGVTVANIKTRYYRGLARLRTILVDLGATRGMAVGEPAEQEES